MSIEIILYRIVIVGLVFVAYMANRKIKWQEKRISHLERVLHFQGKVKDGTLDVG